jgi:hypothetical protein
VLTLEPLAQLLEKKAMTSWLTLLFTSTLLAASPPQGALALHAQAPKASTRVPVTIALVERLADANAATMILRRADIAPYDVILLRSNASGKELSKAVLDLLAIRGIAGDTARSTATVRIRPQWNTVGRTGPELPWAHRVVADLQRAEPRSIPGIGTVRAVEIWLPPARRRVR